MSKPCAMGLWIGPDLAHALAARAVLGSLQEKYPAADWGLFGPSSSACLFEMDERISFYIPLYALEPRRLAQSRLSYFFQKRAQHRQLRQLDLDACLGVQLVVPHRGLTKSGTIQDFEGFLRATGFSGGFIQSLFSDMPLVSPRPVLQAGGQGLAFATQHYRKATPDQEKMLVVLSFSTSNENGIEQQWLSAQKHLPNCPNIHITLVALGATDKLTLRRFRKAQPSCLNVSLAQAVGLVAYADRVISLDKEFTQVCSEMGRADRLVLDKSHT